MAENNPEAAEVQPKKSVFSTGLLSIDALLKEKPGIMSPKNLRRPLKKVLDLKPIPDNPTSK